MLLPGRRRRTGRSRRLPEHARFGLKDGERIQPMIHRATSRKIMSQSQATHTISVRAWRRPLRLAASSFTSPLLHNIRTPTSECDDPLADFAIRRWRYCRARVTPSSEVDAIRILFRDEVASLLLRWCFHLARVESLSARIDGRRVRL
jgi:hypothetical protein